MELAAPQRTPMSVVYWACTDSHVSCTTMNSLLTPEHVAALLQIKAATVYQWLRTGKLGGVKIGRQWRIRPEVLTAFVNGVPSSDTVPQPITQPEREQFWNEVQQWCATQQTGSDEWNEYVEESRRLEGSSINDGLQDEAQEAQ